MTIEKTYELRIRRIASDMEPGMTFTQVVLDDIKHVTEKKVLKSLIHKYTRTIEENDLFGFDNSHNKMVLVALKSRQEKVLSF